MEYSEPVTAEMETAQVNAVAAAAAGPRKPRILLAASGSVAAIKFGNLCHCFSEWAEVKAVATRASLHSLIELHCLRMLCSTLTRMNGRVGIR